MTVEQLIGKVYNRLKDKDFSGHAGETCDPGQPVRQDYGGILH